MPLSEAGRFDNEIELVERHDQHYGIHEEDEEQCHCRKHWRFDDEVELGELEGFPVIKVENIKP